MRHWDAYRAQGKGPALTAAGAKAAHGPARVQAGSHGKPSAGWGGAGRARSAVGDVSPTPPVDRRSDAWCPAWKGGSIPHEGLWSRGPTSHVWSTGNTPQSLPLPMSAWLPAWASGCPFAVPARHPRDLTPSVAEGLPGAWAQHVGPRPPAPNTAPGLQPHLPRFTLLRHMSPPTQMLCCSPEPPH